MLVDVYEPQDILKIELLYRIRTTWYLDSRGRFSCFYVLEIATEKARIDCGRPADTFSRSFASEKA